MVVLVKCINNSNNTTLTQILSGCPKISLFVFLGLNELFYERLSPVLGCMDLDQSFYRTQNEPRRHFLTFHAFALHCVHKQSVIGRLERSIRGTSRWLELHTAIKPVHFERLFQFCEPTTQHKHRIVTLTGTWDCASPCCCMQAKNDHL